MVQLVSVWLYPVIGYALTLAAAQSIIRKVSYCSLSYFKLNLLHLKFTYLPQLHGFSYKEKCMLSSMWKLSNIWRLLPYFPWVLLYLGIIFTLSSTISFQSWVHYLPYSSIFYCMGSTLNSYDKWWPLKVVVMCWLNITEQWEI